jgi:heme-degrading monooxygenase HmoA
MFTRVVQSTGAKDIDGGVAFVRDTVTSVLRQQKGFRGVTASADRSGRVFGVLTVWETDADRDASESAMAKVREEGAKVIGGQMTVELYEEMLVEMAGPPRQGASLLIRRLSMDPAKIDENFEFFKGTVLPQIKASPGFLAVRNMINRSTGDGIVGTVWTDAASMDAAAEAAQQRQAQAEGRVRFGEQSKREVLYIELA